MSLVDWTLSSLLLVDFVAVAVADIIAAYDVADVDIIDVGDVGLATV